MPVDHIWFLGAGSGGHLAPNYALYRELLGRRSDLSARFILTRGHLEQSYAEIRALPCYFYALDRLVRGNVVSRILKVSVCIMQTLWFLYLDKPNLIISTGGYASFPGLLWAKLLKIPYVLIEPNQVIGKVNRWFACGAEIIVSSYPEILKHSSTKVLKLGVPLLLNPKSENTTPETLLAFGASQGAQSINQLIEAVVLGGCIRPLRWIVGARDFEKYRHYAELEGVIVEAFCDDMQTAYENARLVVCRSGAGTVAEIHAMELPAVFIPFPGHSDRQQYLNCAYLQSAGCCEVWEDSQLMSKISELNELWIDDSKIKKMRAAFEAFSASPLSARKRVASIILNLLGNR